MHGPLALFALKPRAAQWSRASLLAARQTAYAAEWTAHGSSGEQRFAPYFAFGEEPAQLYQRLTSI
jgi:hypothetical protein